jgi:hypothetical protein
VRQIATLTVSCTATKDTPDFESVAESDKEKPVVSNAQPDLVSSLKGFHVSFAGADEAIERAENAHGGLSVDPAHVSLR